eukprot:7217499-Pyramimonas_sp.AAC.2
MCAHLAACLGYAPKTTGSKRGFRIERALSTEGGSHDDRRQAGVSNQREVLTTTRSERGFRIERALSTEGGLRRCRRAHQLLLGDGHQQPLHGAGHLVDEVVDDGVRPHLTNGAREGGICPVSGPMARGEGAYA